MSDQTKDDPTKDEELKAASANLEYYLNSAILVINWNCMDQGEVEEDGKREKIAAAYNRFEIQIRDRFPKTAAIINSSLHLFAAISDLYTIDIDFSDPERYVPDSYYEEPDLVIGTSAHQAVIFFLQRAIEADFWKNTKFILDKWHTELLPKLFQKQLQARMHWERLRVFKTSVIRGNHAFENLPSTAEQIEAEADIFDMARRKMTIGGQEAKFSPVPFKLIHYLYTSKNKSASFDELRVNVWGSEVGDRGILSAKDKCNAALLESGLFETWNLSGSTSTQYIALKAPHK